MPFVKSELCTNCKACVPVCPVQAISIKGQSALIDQDKCIKCGACIIACPQKTIRPNSENPLLRGHGAGRRMR
ncbi:MAG: 4Fe-4S binding protein [Candidatus Aureabacteria bacterium]|nr:4Fe-4S binding protein [Candidatus Auribacterota bacterium]